MVLTMIKDKNPGTTVTEQVMLLRLTVGAENKAPT